MPKITHFDDKMNFFCIFFEQGTDAGYIYVLSLQPILANKCIRCLKIMCKIFLRASLEVK